MAEKISALKARIVSLEEQVVQWRNSYSEESKRCSDFESQLRRIDRLIEAISK